MTMAPAMYARRGGDLPKPDPERLKAILDDSGLTLDEQMVALFKAQGFESKDTAQATGLDLAWIRVRLDYPKVKETVKRLRAEYASLLSAAHCDFYSRMVRVLDKIPDTLDYIANGSRPHIGPDGEEVEGHGDLKSAVRAAEIILEWTTPKIPESAAFQAMSSGGVDKVLGRLGEMVQLMAAGKVHVITAEDGTVQAIDVGSTRPEDVEDAEVVPPEAP